LGVSLIIGGVDENETSLFLTDPSGTYIPYNAVAIGAGSDTVTEFLKKYYKPEMTLEESQLLAISSINMTTDDATGSEHIKISQIKSDTKQFEILDNNQITKLLQTAIEKYPIEGKSS
jgi:proteasome alpha subunit